MCRAKHDKGGRRCPGHGRSNTPAAMAARKRLSRICQPVRLQLPAGEPVDERRMGGETAYTHVLTYEDGTRVVRKDHTRLRYSGEDDIGAYSDAEELAPLVLNAVGLRAPAVRRTGEHEIHMEYVDGARGDEIGAATGFDQDISRELVNSRDGRALGLADHLIQHTDRESGENVIQDQDGRLVGVDNGDAFRHGYTHSVFAQPLYDPPRSPDGPRHLATRNDFTPADMATVGRRLQALRPAFERRGRGDWHAAMMQRHAQVATAAKGVENWIA